MSHAVDGKTQSARVSKHTLERERQEWTTKAERMEAECQAAAAEERKAAHACSALEESYEKEVKQLKLDIRSAEEETSQLRSTHAEQVAEFKNRIDVGKADHNSWIEEHLEQESRDQVAALEAGIKDRERSNESMASTQADQLASSHKENEDLSKNLRLSQESLEALQSTLDEARNKIATLTKVHNAEILELRTRIRSSSTQKTLLLDQFSSALVTMDANITGLEAQQQTMCDTQATVISSLKERNTQEVTKMESRHQQYLETVKLEKDNLTKQRDAILEEHKDKVTALDASIHKLNADQQALVDKHKGELEAGKTALRISEERIASVQQQNVALDKTQATIREEKEEVATQLHSSEADLERLTISHTSTTSEFENRVRELEVTIGGKENAARELRDTVDQQEATIAKIKQENDAAVEQTNYVRDTLRASQKKVHDTREQLRSMFRLVIASTSIIDPRIDAASMANLVLPKQPTSSGELCSDMESHASGWLIQVTPQDTLPQASPDALAALIWIHLCINNDTSVIIAYIQALDRIVPNTNQQVPSWERYLVCAAARLAERCIQQQSWDLEVSIVTIVRLLLKWAKSTTVSELQSVLKAVLPFQTSDPTVVFLGRWANSVIVDGKSNSICDEIRMATGRDITPIDTSTNRLLVGSTRGVLLVDQGNERISLYS